MLWGWIHIKRHPKESDKAIIPWMKNSIATACGCPVIKYGFILITGGYDMGFLSSSWLQSWYEPKGSSPIRCLIAWKDSFNRSAGQSAAKRECLRRYSAFSSRARGREGPLWQQDQQECDRAQEIATLTRTLHARSVEADVTVDGAHHRVPLTEQQRPQQVVLALETKVCEWQLICQRSFVHEPPTVLQKGW